MNTFNCRSNNRVMQRAKKRVPVDSQILERAISINQIAHASNMNQSTDSEQIYLVLEEYNKESSQQSYEVFNSMYD
ncbi:MAG: hypothetical protein WCK32_03115 [Chlorobiaceae bacterium]